MRNWVSSVHSISASTRQPPTWRLGLVARVLTIISFARAALCQVYDSIFMDVPMSRVKFNVNTEYAYIQNFKVLQSKSTPPMLAGSTT